VVRIDTGTTVLTITGTVRYAAVEELGAVIDRAASVVGSPVVVDLREAELDRGVTAALRDRCPDARLELPALRSLPGGGDVWSDPRPGSVHVAATGSRVVITLAGEIDAALAGDLRGAAQDALATGLPIDVLASQATFIDSSGLRFLMRLATGSHHRLRLVRPSPQARFIIELTDLGAMLDTVWS